MRLGFVSFIGFRYFRARRRGVGGTSTLLSILGVAVGVTALTAVTGVMNGFQLGFIESILEISSYHLQVAGVDEARRDDVLASLRSLPSVRSAVPFSEHQVIIEGRFSEPRGCLLRGVPADVRRLDPSFSSQLDIVSGSFELAAPGSIVLGVELSRHLGVGVGDSISILSLQGAGFGELEPSSRFYRVAGLFRSGYYEFDLGWAFVSLGEAAALSSASDPPVTIGVKLHHRFRDQRAAEVIARLLEGEAMRIISWREFNKAFFGALRMEKIIMTLLIGMIFVVVGFNIHHGLRRAVRQRYEEIGVLKALGATDAALRRIFVLEGLLIGTIGAFLGMLLGMLISANINAVFAFAEMSVNAVLSFLDLILFPLLRNTGSRFSLFSPAYFYITEIPSTVMVREAVLIVAFAVITPTAAAAAAAARVKDVRPAEVLRYE